MSDYSSNVVLCKLFTLVRSPVEQVLGKDIVSELSNPFDNRRCWVRSDLEYRQFTHCDGRSVFLVSNYLMPDIGEVDFAVFYPNVSRDKPLVVIEVDCHDFHERTREQASRDRRRIRKIQSLGIPILPFTGTDVVRGSTEAAREVAEFVDRRIAELSKEIEPAF
jgi:hypothetical protein